MNNVTYAKSICNTSQGWWRRKGGHFLSVKAVSPLLPGAQCRCGGPSPRRHSMVWHTAHFSPLTVSSWTGSHANTWAVGGFFLFSCRSRVLNNIQKDSATYHPLLAKIRSHFFPPPLPNIFLSYRWKGTDTQWCNVEKKFWLTVFKVMEQTEWRVRGQRPPFRGKYFKYNGL